MTDETPPLTQERILKAAANALWPLLQTRRWTPHTIKRAISPTGNPRNNTHPTGGNPNTSSPTIEVLSHEPYLRAIATRDQTHLGYGLAIEITRAHALDALRVCSHAELAEYDEALTFANRQPYLWDGVEQAWRRNYRDEYHTPRAQHALLTLTSAATIEPLTAEQEAELYDDGEPIELVAVQRALRDGGA